MRRDIGAEAVRLLVAQGIPADVVAWVQDPASGRWELQVATPLVESEGEAAARGRVREALDRPALPPEIDLAQVVLRPPSDPAMTELRAFRSRFGDSWPLRTARSADGLTEVDAGWVYPVRRVAYERSVLAAARRVLPPSATLRTRFNLLARTGARRWVDFWIRIGRREIAVETHAGDTPMTCSDLQDALEGLPFLARPVLVSRSGFTTPSRNLAARFVHLVTWRDSSDDRALGRALRGAAQIAVGPEEILASHRMLLPRVHVRQAGLVRLHERLAHRDVTVTGDLRAAVHDLGEEFSVSYVAAPLLSSLVDDTCGAIRLHSAEDACTGERRVDAIMDLGSRDRFVASAHAAWLGQALRKLEPHGFGHPALMAAFFGDPPPRSAPELLDQANRLAERSADRVSPR